MQIRPRKNLNSKTQIMKKTFILFYFLVFSVISVQAQNVYVNQNATGTNDGTSWTDAYTSLQSALATATSGDKIYVATGTYKPSNQFDFDGGGANVREVTFQIPDGVEVYGGFIGNESPINTAVLDARNFTANPTILSGDIGTPDDMTDNAYHVVYTKNVSSNTIVDRLTFTSGNAAGSFPNNVGGGWYNRGSVGNSSNPTLRNIIFSSNCANNEGGGMYNYGASTGISSPTLTNCTFSSNSTNGNGGGIFNFGASTGISSPTFTSCTFTNNTASFGGGIYNIGQTSGISSPTFTSCTFTNNTANTSGGGILNNGDGGTSSPTLTNCTFSNNSASDNGGGIYNIGKVSGISSPDLTNCTFTNNTADRAGGMYNLGHNSGNCTPTLTNCTFYNNSANDKGGGMYNKASSSGTCIPKIRNNIFWNNTGTTEGNSWYNDSATPNVAHTLVQEVSGGLHGTNTVGADMIYNQNPLFKDVAGGDFSLKDNSPAINAGNNTDITATGVTTDANGNARKVGGTVDLGAFESIMYYVNYNAGGSNNGTYWTDAFTDLQSALAIAVSGDKIYIAKGTYYPSQRYNFSNGTDLGAGGAGDRDVAFKIPDGVEVYGGFAGTESPIDLNARDFTTNKTILSGDIGTSGINADNAYHVVYTHDVSSATIVDGLTFTSGNANGSSPNDKGAGWYNDGTSSPTLTNCTFSHNSASDDGGGMYNYGYQGTSNPTLTNCTFSNNSASDNGGGMYNYG